MSSFGSKRKARKIQVDEDEDEGLGNSSPAETGSPVVKPANRKPFKKSALRHSVAVDDDAEKLPVQSDSDVLPDAPKTQSSHNGDELEERPALNRMISSSKKKKKGKSSRLSFGPGEIISGDDAEALEESEVFTPKKGALGRRVVETNAFKKSSLGPRIPIRTPDEDDRPTYSKDYLDQLKSSTPSTPKDLGPAAQEEEGLDEAELEGATIVDVAEKFGSTSLTHGESRIPTEAEIREKKERRLRLAQEKDYVSFDDDEDDERQMILSRDKKPATRLVRDDEDFAEGFDEYVEDGGISLGKKAERETARRQRAEMASLINAAEGSSGEETDESEVERLEAYEAAQTRAGMDGLRKSRDRHAYAAATHPALPPKPTALPNFADALSKFMDTLAGAQQELAAGEHRLAELKQEKEEIASRRGEVQQLLKQAGEQFAAEKGEEAGDEIDPTMLLEAQAAAMDPFAGSRGLESFGNTPTVPMEVEDTV